MNDLERLLLASTRMQLQIAKMKLMVCYESSHNARHLQADMLAVEIKFLTEFIERYD